MHLMVGLEEGHPPTGPRARKDGTMTKRKRHNPQSSVDSWNASHPVGTAVKVRKDGGEVVESETRSEAWVLGGHTAVVMVTGIRGCYLLNRVTP